jgi:hypothetical protein
MAFGLDLDTLLPTSPAVRERPIWVCVVHRLDATVSYEGSRSPSSGTNGAFECNLDHEWQP